MCEGALKIARALLMQEDFFEGAPKGCGALADRDEQFVPVAN